MLSPLLLLKIVISELIVARARTFQNQSVRKILLNFRLLISIVIVLIVIILICHFRLLNHGHISGTAAKFELATVCNYICQVKLIFGGEETMTNGQLSQAFLAISGAEAGTTFGVILYVCMYAYMHECMHDCMFACMHV